MTAKIFIFDFGDKSQILVTHFGSFLEFKNLFLKTLVKITQVRTPEALRDESRPGVENTHPIYELGISFCCRPSDQISRNET